MSTTMLSLQNVNFEKKPRKIYLPDISGQEISNNKATCHLNSSLMQVKIFTACGEFPEPHVNNSPGFIRFAIIVGAPIILWAGIVSLIQMH